MAANLVQESPEEKAERLRQQARKRAQLLGVILIVVVALRFAVKDPPKYVEPDVKQMNLTYIPGTLESMPEAARAKLSPQQIAKYKEMDKAFYQKQFDIKEAAEDDWEVEDYVPQEAPSDIQEDIEGYKEEVFRYALRKKKMEEIREQMQLDADISKPVLVMHKRGGYLRVEKADKIAGGMVALQFDRSIKLRLQNNRVKSISTVDRNWKEPIPKGYVKIKPARGITYIVRKRTAKRISVKKDIFFNEI